MKNDILKKIKDNLPGFFFGVNIPYGREQTKDYQIGYNEALANVMFRIEWIENGKDMSTLYNQYISDEDYALKCKIEEEIKKKMHKRNSTIEGDKQSKYCIWIYCEEMNFYETQCQEAFCFLYAKKEKEFKFCPYCGKRIKDK